MLRFFRSISIRFRLLILVAVLCLFTAAASLLGYARLAAARDDLDDMYKSGVLPVFWTNDIRNNVNRIRSNLLLMILTDDEAEMRNLFDQIVERRKMNDENLSNYKKIDLEEREIKRLADAEKHLAEFRAASGEVFELAMQNKDQEAFDVFRQKAEKSLDGLQDAQRDLAAFAIDWSDRTNQEDAAEIATAIKVLVTLATISVALGVFLGIVIALSVARALNGLTSQVGVFAEGDLTVRFDTTGRDEVTTVARALEAMGGKLREVMGAINEASQRLGTTAEEFSALAEESNAGVEESRAGVDDVSSQMENLAAASEEITASVQEVASGAQSSAQKSTEMAGEVETARASGEEGTKAVANVARSVAKMAEDAARSAGEVKNLGDRAREIQNFVAQIGGIADQTNLLALNA
ncbi:MAG: methyl-accepting chemotaxis protein, partial [Synergistaceae bacterium]|nr:methyl-accepting chemotaxis protein [Synergistaceae bacterium]